MVTASHNPPQDNGYKVYLGDGSQIVPPADAEISAEIEAVGPLAGVPRSDDWETLGEEVLDAYLDRVAGLVDADVPARPDRRLHPAARRRPRRRARPRSTAPASPRRPSSRGRATRTRSSAPSRSPTPRSRARSTWRWPRPSSTTPTWCWPTTRTPTGAPSRSPTPTAPAGWRMLRGDEVGALLAAHLVRRDPQLSGTFAASIVSSSLLGRIAAAHGLGYVETLTGFKWISRVEGLRYGYEEALGYCVDPDGVRDKDGVSAALLVAELAATLKAEGRTPDRPARRPGPRARPARHRPALGAGRRRRADRGRDGPAARAAADDAGRPGGRARRGPRRRLRRPAADRRAALPAGRRRPGGRAAVRAPSRSSRPTSRWWCRWSTTTSPLPGVRPTRRSPRSRPTSRRCSPSADQGLSRPSKTSVSTGVPAGRCGRATT